MIHDLKANDVFVLSDVRDVVQFRCQAIPDSDGNLRAFFRDPPMLPSECCSWSLQWVWGFCVGRSLKIAVLGTAV